MAGNSADFPGEGLREIVTDSNTDRLGQRLGWIIRLRWLAVTAAVLTAYTARFVFEAISATSTLALALIALVMLGYNTYFFRLPAADLAQGRIARAQVLLDLAAFTLMLFFTGGAQNPFATFYIFHIVIAGVLLPKKQTHLLALSTALLFCAMVLLQESGALPSFPLQRGSVAQGLIHETGGWIAVAGVLLGFTTTVGGLAYFTTSIMRRVRRDMAQLLRAQDILSQERGKLEDIARTVGAAMLILDPQGRIVWSNEIAGNWFGEGVSPQHCYERLWHSESKCEGCLETSIGDMESTQMRERVLLVGGRRRHFLVSSSQVHSADGELHQVLALVQDITAMKEMEIQLHQAGKMVAVGQLAAGIAHEISNPLAVVSSSTEILQDYAHEEGDPAGQGSKLLLRHLTKIDDSVYRCKAIIDSLLGFARRDVGGFENVSVRRLLDETIELARHSAQAKRCEIVADYAIEARSLISSEHDRLPTTSHLRTRPRELQQVVLNLILNAVDATPAGGSVTVSVEPQDGTLDICVSDTGEGIAPEHLDRIFEPFFTTKPVGQGTGLGLYLTRQLLLPALEGAIAVQSQPGQGATFRVSLPWELVNEPRKRLPVLETA